MPTPDPVRRRRQGAAGVPAVLLALSIAAVAAAAGTVVSVTVRPSQGGQGATFTVAWRNPERTGVHGTLRRTDQVSVALRGHTGSVAHPLHGCIVNAGGTAPPAAAGALVRMALGPARIGGRWCAGRWSGRIEEVDTPVCRPGTACPQFIVVRGVVGRFSFTVAPDAGPAFAGIVSAVACTPGPQRPGETTPFTLSWRPASDPLTPSAQIVYEVFEAPAPGREDYAHPTWTTAPGATSFRTPGLPSHGTFYFVVRARDAAGRTDANTVELRGSDPCL
jgi:hypothetical protein